MFRDFSELNVTRTLITIGGTQSQTILTSGQQKLTSGHANSVFMTSVMILFSKCVLENETRKTLITLLQDVDTSSTDREKRLTLKNLVLFFLKEKEEKTNFNFNLFEILSNASSFNGAHLKKVCEAIPYTAKDTWLIACAGLQEKQITREYTPLMYYTYQTVREYYIMWEENKEEGTNPLKLLSIL